MALKPVASPRNELPWKIVNRGADRAEIYVYGVIGGDWFGEGVTAKQFADDLKKIGDVKTIDLRINSEGGDVFAGKTMYTLLTQHKAKIVTHVDGLAASAASYVAMAGKEIRISEGAFVMIHRAWTVTMGNAADHERQVDLLKSVDASIRDVYVARTNKTAAQVDKWMEDETWFTGKEAVENGFADVLVENMRVAAKVSDACKFKNIPTSLLPRRAAALATISELRRK